MKTNETIIKEKKGFQTQQETFYTTKQVEEIMWEAQIEIIKEFLYYNVSIDMIRIPPVTSELAIIDNFFKHIGII